MVFGNKATKGSTNGQSKPQNIFFSQEKECTESTGRKLYVTNYEVTREPELLAGAFLYQISIF